jgi:hypothetical protein
MSLPLPNLDDHTFTELVDEARGLIPVYAPNWTNHNPSDPGITLIELFAWLTEMLLYRANQVSRADHEVFLRLLRGPDWVLTGSVDDAIRETVLGLRARYRAVTAVDYEELATRVWPTTPEAQTLGAKGVVRRARCLPGRNLEAPGGNATAPGHISLIVLSGAASEQPLTPAQVRPDKLLLEGLWAWLDQRRLLTTRHHVVGPSFAEVKLTAKLFLRQDAVAKDVRAACIKDSRAFFHPLTGGPTGQGWPFGRNVHVSEVYQLLEKVPGVDYVAEVKLSGPPEEQEGGEVVAVKLAPHELVDLSVEDAGLALCRLTVKDGAEAEECE